jgi:hypothetical protein
MDVEVVLALRQPAEVVLDQDVVQGMLLTLNNHFDYTNNISLISKVTLKTIITQI